VEDVVKPGPLRPAMSHDFCPGIGRDGLDAVEFVVDRSAAKQGLLTPGPDLPIMGPAHGWPAGPPAHCRSRGASQGKLSVNRRPTGMPESASSGPCPRCG